MFSGRINLFSWRTKMQENVENAFCPRGHSNSIVCFFPILSNSLNIGKNWKEKTTYLTLYNS